jgi:hypothetical protein
MLNTFLPILLLASSLEALAQRSGSTLHDIQKNCKFPNFPEDKCSSSEAVAPYKIGISIIGHGYWAYVYPRAVDIDANYEGCQLVWWDYQGERRLIRRVEIKKGRAVEAAFSCLEDSRCKNDETEITLSLPHECKLLFEPDKLTSKQREELWEICAVTGAK